MKTTFFAIICVIFLSGCGSNERSDFKSKWELSQPHDKDGLLYRINKESGEVYLLAGAQATMVEGTENSDAEKPRIAAKKAWESFEFDSLGKQARKVKVQLKTAWRDNRMYYRFILSGSTTNYLEELQTSSPDGRFVFSLNDDDGFELLQIQVRLSDISQPSLIIQKFGKSFGDLSDFHISYADYTLERNSSVVCGYGTYDRLKVWNVRALGFTQ